jgi:hypothetical protein
VRNANPPAKPAANARGANTIRRSGWGQTGSAILMANRYGRSAAAAAGSPVAHDGGVNPERPGRGLRALCERDGDGATGKRCRVSRRGVRPYSGRATRVWGPRDSRLPVVRVHRVPRVPRIAHEAVVRGRRGRDRSGALRRLAPAHPGTPHRPPISTSNHARAYRHMRSAVAPDTPNTAAASSPV